MSEKARSDGGPAPVRLSGDQVAAWLRAHPDFLLRRRELLGVLALPTRDFGEPVAGQDGRIVDLQLYMLAHLRNEVRKREQQVGALVNTGRDAMHSQGRVHAAALAVMGARSLDHLIELVTTDLAVHLDVDAATLSIETSGGVSRVGRGGIRVLPIGTVDTLLGEGRDVMLRDSVAGDRRLYGEAAGLVRSDALVRVPVRAESPPALLALGSRDVRRFHAGQSGELLAFLARVVAQAIRAWVGVPGPA
ncbi:MAG: DUF484 family protein [Alphaproteobacteria bacterium]|nr:DUF484 family protein [Alphaproteobacteria bacterium]